MVRQMSGCRLRNGAQFADVSQCQLLQFVDHLAPVFHNIFSAACSTCRMSFSGRTSLVGRFDDAAVDVDADAKLRSSSL